MKKLMEIMEELNEKIANLIDCTEYPIIKTFLSRMFINDLVFIESIIAIYNCMDYDRKVLCYYSLKNYCSFYTCNICW